MKFLISNAQVCDLRSPYHGKSCDIFLNSDRIEKIQVTSKKSGTTNTKGYKIIDAKGAYAFPGLFDMRADFCDPGYEFKETLESGARVALSGGFTDVALLPSTKPARDGKVGVEYVVNQSNRLPVNLHPYGCLSQAQEGKEMAELFDMQSAGACGFTDGNRPVAHSGLLMRALQYARIFNGFILVLADDPHLSASGRMHEGNVSTLLGLKGVPSIAEEVVVHRDIEILRYTGGRLHFSAVTSRASVELIRKARKQGLQVSADVAFANLCYTDEQLADYDANFKVLPPLRSRTDQKALWEGLEDGTIDAIVSNHEPQNKESKLVEFEYALPGMISLQVMLPVLVQHMPKNFKLATLIKALTENPRRLLGKENITLEEGTTAAITLFDPNQSWEYSKNHSLSENSPLLGQKIMGCVTHVFCKDQVYTQ